MLTVNPKAVRHGKLPQEDWDVIVSMISRLPDPHYQENLNLVYCTGGLDMTVAVELEFDWHYRILFVKTGPKTWVVAATSEVNI